MSMFDLDEMAEKIGTVAIARSREPAGSDRAWSCSIRFLDRKEVIGWGASPSAAQEDAADGWSPQKTAYQNRSLPHRGAIEPTLSEILAAQEPSTQTVNIWRKPSNNSWHVSRETVGAGWDSANGATIEAALRDLFAPVPEAPPAVDIEAMFG